jgi:radical SAM superfamily enzyme YgiQ (UPF0313 family)
MAPLGLITIAAMLPESFQLRLVDLNIEPLSDEHIEWADFVFLSAMLPQKRSLFEVAGRCRQLGKRVVMGGPYPTLCADECAPWCDTIVCGEAEAVWETFLPDLIRDQLRPSYSSNEKPDITGTPAPRFDLLKINTYLTIPIQFSRGCPFLCEFCDIIVVFGRRPRTNTPEQMIRELEGLRRAGYAGEVFIVDDNFIGNKKEVKRLLPVLRQWNASNAFAFSFGTEASIDLAEHDDLMQQMFESGFRWVFVGIETPSREGLKETLKFQNLKRPMDVSVDRIRSFGMYVTAGFIIGFDTDGSDIFDRQIEFISTAGIAFAMVGLLFAVNGTPLYDRMKATGRLHPLSTDSNEDHCGYTNIKTVLPRLTLMEGYRRVMATLYSPEEFFERGFQTLTRLKRPDSLRNGLVELAAEVRRNSRFLIAPEARQRGLVHRATSFLKGASRAIASLSAEFRRAYFRFVLRVLRTRPDKLGGTLELLVFGWHFYRFTVDNVFPQVDAEVARLEREEAEQMTLAV